MSNLNRGVIEERLDECDKVEQNGIQTLLSALNNVEMTNHEPKKIPDKVRKRYCGSY